MRPRSGDLARPLLCATGEETRAWCDARGLDPRRDSSNDDRAIRRNLIRHEVMPALRRVHPGAERNLARTAELLGELDDLLRSLADEHVEAELDLERLEGLPPALRAIVLREAAEQAAGQRLSLAADLEAVRDRTVLSFAPPERYPHRS